MDSCSRYLQMPAQFQWSPPGKVRIVIQKVSKNSAKKLNENSNENSTCTVCCCFLHRPKKEYCSSSADEDVRLQTFKSTLLLRECPP